MTIVSRGGTFLKAEPKPSSMLDQTQLHFVRANISFQAQNLGRRENNHQLFQFSSPIRGRSNWWIFAPHWNLGSRQNQTALDEIDWFSPNCRVSRFFTVNEVTMGDTRRIPMDNGDRRRIFALAQELDKVREEWGGPLLVTSWYRPEPINRQVGGVRNSSHTLGHAADICPADGDPIAFERWLDSFWGDRALGYGQAAGRGFTHVDLRPGRIRWDY